MLTNKLIFCVAIMAAVLARPESPNDVEHHVFTKRTNNISYDENKNEEKIITTDQIDIAKERAELEGTIEMGKQMAEKFFNTTYEVLVRQFASYVILNRDIPLDAKVRTIRFRRMRHGARINKFLSYYEFNGEALKRIQRRMVWKVLDSFRSEEGPREAGRNFGILLVMQVIASLQEKINSL